MSKTFTVLFFIFLNLPFVSQIYILSGKISDKTEALPFATVIVKGSNYNTISNVNGLYNLKLPAGNYEIVFQYIGYARKTEKVILNENKTLNIFLNPDAISLKEVEIKAGEDPAYPIMRQAIKNRKHYLNQLDAYTCNAYIKGLQKINGIPKNIRGLIKLAGGELSDTNEIKGVIYLSESVSKYHFQKPEKEKEIMLSSKVSGDNKSFSFNKLSDMKLNFYNNLILLGNVSDRPFISPLNENAFLFYRYYLMGTVQGEGKTINKIKVVPKHKTDPCFSGVIYIQDSTWRITSIDLMLSKEAKINFIDTLNIKQLHASIVGDSLWMPLSLNLTFDLHAFGFEGNGYFNANLSAYDLNPVYPKNFFNNEILKVEDDANKKDSIYWENIRTTPLTQEEINDYRKKDSISKIRDTDRYKDSVDKQRNKLKLRDIFFGYEYNKTKKNFNVLLPGLIANGIQYNTVEGLNLSYKFSINKTFEDFRRFTVSGRARYGFSNKLWGGEVGFNYYYKPKSFSNFGFKIKSIAEQYNQLDPISPLINSMYSLLLNENYMKVFKETGVEGNYFTELSNGVFFTGIVRYMQRDPLRNTSDILIIDDRSKLFTSNDPRNAFTHDSMFSTNRAFTTEFTFTFRFKQRYYSLPDQKVLAGSKYPRLSVTYKRAFPILNTSADYDLLSASLSDRIRLGLFGNLAYRIRGGGFIDTKKLFFMDFKYFLGNQTIFNTNDYLSSFRLLPYYTFSADRWFSEIHAEHHFQGFIISQIPLIKRLKIQEVIGGHFLTSNKLKYYYEINFGLEKIFRIIRLDYVLGYAPDTKLKQGFTLGINLSF
ncbi:DUF5686 and carboxypeptidase regulatory-like domain-containing protein [Aurantibacillus circumpalustris]|uniref:DUF5686 and carboxypeptidase regulatory-like domain-containing protein n=1 Tax=Aurantibacillus circumpalustris TaxID=3036359 RepID=UPI00295A7C19|nr:DUF5686 and carboxypeptidase regulatory-like domain-containing protein [Aurantibacillus circumpalustris]